MSGVRVRKQQRKMMAEINVVPYIDVMLVLLVIFMTTAPMLTQGVSVELPQTSSAPIASSEEPVMITVAQDGTYYINVGGESDQATTLKEVTRRVQVVHEQNPGTLFLVEGDRDVPYGKVVTLMAKLQSAGIKKVGLVTEPPGHS